MLELGERDDLVHHLAHAGAGKPVDRPVQVDVLAAGEVRMETGTELEQGPDPPSRPDATARRLDDPRDKPEEGRLARPVAADQPHCITPSDRDGHVAERPDVDRLAAPAQDEQVLQRTRLLCPDAKAAGRVLGMSRLTYHRIETGARHIHFTELAAICAAFNCHIGELVQDGQLASAFIYAAKAILGEASS